ncbi:hypothetical protein AMK59_6526 [Oryctes borbonicus]|uniref:PIN domain-containing protein n=1 Tax=Oryctes borbonicus TaxID=1629725 RepID=A0A0T6ATN7_9SCAR|nr:hypothetical protein AMK59_6526 [Oryctes borbonicus]
MKKSYPTDIHQKEGQEQSKKLYRYISDQVKIIDDARDCARSVSDLFTPVSNVQRSKFRDYCERLIFSNPLLHARKGEELLWRKAFYEVVATAKRLKKVEHTPQEKASIENHINVGIGHYHHYIARLQQEYDLELNGIVDFIICNDYTMKKSQSNGTNSELLEWARLSVHRSLVYLGDLCRYRLDIYPNWDNNLVVRYYSQALCFKPEYGMPHNQMGTLANNTNNSLDATYYYLRSMDCKLTFEGTENNLSRLLEKNSHYLEQLPIENNDADCIIQPEPAEHIKRFIARFLLLVDVWWFNKKIPLIYDLCHQTNVDLQECMMYLKPINSDSIDTTDMDTADTDSTNSTSFLSHDTVFKIVSICLLCVQKLQFDHSQHVSSAVPFTLAVYSQLVQTVIGHIMEGILNFPLPTNENNINKWLSHNKQHKIKKRRRRKVQNNSEDENEEESSENESLSAFNMESDEEAASDIELDPCSSTDDEEENKKTDEKLLNGINDDKSDDKNSSDGAKTMEEILKKSKRLDQNDILAIISDEQLLQCIRILNDWLMTDSEILKTGVRSTKTLLNQIINVINLLHIDIDGNDSKLKQLRIDVLKANEKKIALPEDVVLKGVQILAQSQAEIDWNYSSNVNLTTKEQNVLRIMKIVSFGQSLTTMAETGVTYSSADRLFSINVDEPHIMNGFDETENRDMENGDSDIIKREDELKPFETTKGQLMKMKHMGQLWLTAEVRDLESRVKGKTALSPYLVIDADSLILYTPMVKQLVYSRKFIVLVPSAVVSALDDLKRERLEARDAIRWLESQFHQGNRFFRAQRPQERLPIPYIKYPKKKDKDTLIYIQIIECCHYLAQQQKGASNLVTLLLGNASVLNNNESKDFSYVGLAQSAGVNLELIADFYGKWKKTMREKR